MAIKVLMPQVAETVVEGTISRWLKRVGDIVAKYDPLVEIETAKVVTEVPSPAAGTLKSILASEGATLPVGAELAIIEETEAAAPSPAAEAPRPPAPARATPAVRRLAQEHDLDLAQVHGTGLGGRVTREDVERFLARRQAPPPAAPPPVEAEEEVIPLTPTRRTIAEHMVRSKRTAPHTWALMEADVTGLVALRASHREEFRRAHGFSLTYFPFAVLAAVESLKEFPYMNASWAEDRIILKRRIHIGVAVAREEGLIVPVLHDAQDMGLVAIARGIDDIVGRARAGRLSVADISGGTFTVNNTGAFGSIASVPIINQPQAAILTFEAIVKRPVVINDAIAIRSMVNLCLSFDHRVVDGAQVGAFLQGVVRRLEAYGPGTKLD